jgi:hypothetical protein
MQAIEAGSNSGAALGVVITPDNEEGVLRELRMAREAMLAWRDRHGDQCDTIMLTATADPELHPSIVSILDETYRTEEDLSSFLQSVKVEVALLNMRGKPVKRYRLGQPVPDKPIKPWWKFW